MISPIVVRSWAAMIFSLRWISSLILAVKRTSPGGTSPDLPLRDEGGEVRGVERDFCAAVASVFSGNRLDADLGGVVCVVATFLCFCRDVLVDDSEGGVRSNSPICDVVDSCMEWTIAGDYQPRK